MSSRAAVKPVRNPCHIGAPRVGRRQLLTAAAGAALAPFLPILNSRAQAAGAPKRFLFCFQDNGTVHSEWKPTGTGTSFTFKRILAPLEAHKQDLLLISGLNLDPEPGPPHSGHPQLLSNVPADLGRFRLSRGVTLDQFVAQQRMDATRFATLELGIVPFGGDDFYTREVLYRGPYDPVPCEPSPYAAFQRLFAVKNDASALRERTKTQSIFNGVKSDLTSLRAELGADDRALLDRHADAILALERRVGEGPSACRGPALGAELDFRSMANYEKMAELQMDLMVAAFACDATRIGSLIWSGPTSTQTFPWLGNFGENHHLLSHNPNAIEPLIQINTWYSQQHAKLIEKLKAVPEAGGGTLFDSTLIFFANPLSDGNAHRKIDLPFILAGGKWYFQTGRYLDFGSKPHGQLLVSLAHALGVEVPAFGAPETGTGPLSGLEI